MENDSGDIRRSPTPHDLTFKQFLTHPETARDFMQLHLPADLQALCDFSTLKRFMSAGARLTPGPPAGWMISTGPRLLKDFTAARFRWWTLRSFPTMTLWSTAAWRR